MSIANFISQNNEKCNGKSVTIVSEDPKHVRVLHSLCTCNRANGNFSGSSCNFVSFRHLYSDASSIETIKPNPDARASLLYNYIPDNSSSQDTHNHFESLRNLDDTKSKVRSLMGVSSNVDDDAMFNNSPEYVAFPLMKGYSAVIVDFETTSLDVNKCHILELALLSLHEERLYSGESRADLSCNRSLHLILSDNIIFFQTISIQGPIIQSSKYQGKPLTYMEFQK